MTRSRQGNVEVKGAISPSCLDVLTVFTKKGVHVDGSENRNNGGTWVSIRVVFMALSGCGRSRQSRHDLQSKILAGVRASRPSRGRHGDKGETRVETAPVGGDAA